MVEGLYSQRVDATRQRRRRRYGDVKRLVFSRLTGGIMRKLWRLWALSLGEKLGDNNREADIVASMRSAVVLLNLITCLFIIAGVVHNW